MAYTDEALKTKLSTLNETQESIVTVSQWVMFHRRHAVRIAQFWLQRVRDSGSSKRLNLIYLANEVAQQSKARHKEDFLNALSPIIADATATAYKGATNEVQQKLRRVVEVWRQRQIFELPIQEAVEARIDEIDKSRSGSKKPLMGASLFSDKPGSLPSELQPLAPLQVALTKATLSSTSAVNTANTDYDKSNEPGAPTPSLPVHAARLSALLKALANAENLVAESIKARQALIEGLEKLLESNRANLAQEQSRVSELATRKSLTENKKREVEDCIMRGLSAENSPAARENGSPVTDGTIRASEGPEVEAPQVEALTPPPVEALTPVRSPLPDNDVNNILAAVSESHQPTPAPAQTVMPGADLLSSLTMARTRAASITPVGSSSAKRRKLSHGDEFVGFGEGDAMADLDDDVAELLRQGQEGAKT